VIRIATRGSALALWQAHHVAGLLCAAHGIPDTDVELVVVSTTGDRRTDVPLHTIGGQGVFVKEVQQAVLEGRADLAVHSAKDLPSAPTPGLRLAAMPERGDPRDALVGRSLDQLDEGATIATGSVRRRAQIAHLRPDLQFVELRGNIQTRLERIPDGGAIVMAVAALQRLGIEDRIAQAIDVEVMCPQVAQGAIAVECRDDASGDGVAALLRAVAHEATERAVRLEQAFLRQLGTGCSLPVAAHQERSVSRFHTFVQGEQGRVHASSEPVSAEADAAARAIAGFAAVSGS
jgi:hydroxymethylbilane synthase